MSQTKAQLLGPVLGDVNFDNNTLFVDNVNNRVGFGVSNPIQKVHIDGSALISNNNYYYAYSSVGNQTSLIGITSSNNIIIGQNNANHSNTYLYGGTGNIYLNTGNDNRLTVTPGGNVGIGNSNPQSKLDVNGNITSSTITLTESYPTISPSLNLNFANSRSLDHRITFTRASNATYVGKDGLIKTVGYDEPRFDHDPETLESLGLLLEESRTNLITNSNSPTSASGGTRTDNSQVAPDGTTTAGQLVSDSSTGYHAVIYTLNSLPSGNKFAWSIFVKLGTSNYTKVVLYDNAQTSPGSGVSRFDLSTGTKETGTGKIVAYPNGWYRLTIYGERTFTPTSSSLHLFFHNGTTVSFTGDGTSTFYYWGAQLEDNVEFETSYIPTSGSSVTRANDVASITGESFSSWFNNDEGTLVLTADIGDLSVANQSQVAIENTANPTGRFLAMGYRVGGNASGGVGAWYTDNGTTSAYFGIAAGVTSRSEWKQSFAYKLNDFAASANGSATVSDGAGGINTTPFDRLRFGIYVYGDTMDTGHIKSFSYYPKRLTDAQLQQLTS